MAQDIKNSVKKNREKIKEAGIKAIEREEKSNKLGKPEIAKTTPVPPKRTGKKEPKPWKFKSKSKKSKSKKSKSK